MSRRVRGADAITRKTHGMRGKMSGNDNRGLANDKDARELPLAVDVLPASWLTDEEKEVFTTLRNALIDSNSLVSTDWAALQLLSMQYTEFLALCVVIQEEGRTIDVEDTRGNIQNRPHPLLNERSRCFTHARGLLVEFGLTPSSRRTVLKADVNKPDNSAEDEWDEVLGKSH